MKVLGGTARDIKKGNRNTESQEAKFVLSDRDKIINLIEPRKLIKHVYILETNSIRW